MKGNGFGGDSLVHFGRKVGAGRVGGGDVDDFGGRLLLDAGDVRVLHDADADARLVGRHVGRLDGETHLTVGRPNDDVLVDSSFGFSSCFFFFAAKTSNQVEAFRTSSWYRIKSTVDLKEIHSTTSRKSFESLGGIISKKRNVDG